MVKGTVMAMTFEEEAIRLQVSQAQSDINKCYDSIVGKQDRRVIPEDLFVNEFLPYFSGQKSFSEGNNVLGNWVTVAGTPFAEVNVIDQSGNTVVTVPGLTTTLQHKLAERSGTPLHDIVVQAEVVGSQQQVLGNRYLNNKLDEKQREIIGTVMPEALVSVKSQWDDIFKHYNVASESKEEFNKTTELPLDEDVSYE